ncbi:hypothetical protein ACJDT4_09400 [Clostridium neuense]|uniref:Uncharacterized protein n=1 Tax=Clostridium neuense TaxID=1728934 RepID=A0ABW8TI83_9CLOT
MIKSQRDKIKNLKEKVADVQDGSEKKKVKKEIGNIIRQGIIELKSQVDKNNLYKKYIDNNMEMITNKYAFNVTVNDHKEAVELLKTLDIRQILNIGVKLNVPFESKIFFNVEELEGKLCDTEEEAKIAIEDLKLNGKTILLYSIKQTKFKKWTYKVTYKKENERVYINKVNGKYKLFFKRNEEVDRGVEEESFDILNLYEIIMDEKDTYQCIKQLCTLFNIKIKYCIDQEKKYNFNVKIMLDKDYMKNKYKNLYKYINRYLHILEEILEVGSKNINHSMNNFMGENVFFCSGRELSERLKEKNKIDLNVKTKTQSQLSKIINVFCILGLLIKLRNDQVPDNMWREPKKNNKFQNYFIVKRYTDNDFNEAEKIVINLKQNKISVTKMTGDLCKKILGEKVYNEVYLNNEKSTKKAQATIKKKRIKCRVLI